MREGMHTIIDAHQHCWRYHPVQHAWIDDAMAAIRRDFMPADLEAVLAANGVAGCVAVQADQTEAETDFLLELASRHAFIKGVVGWVDLRSDTVEERLEYYQQFPLLKGFRHILQGEDPAFMLQPTFLRGISLLQRYGFTYDILVFPQHLPAVLELVKQFPDQPFVIDHIAKPYIKDRRIDGWKKEMQALANYPHLMCKISGMVTEADTRQWKADDFIPYLDAVTNAFGTDRLMYGSDWPVCLVAASYEQVLGIVQNYFSSFSATGQEAVFSKNAAAFYHLI
jgi:L-fuconolactonase